MSRTGLSGGLAEIPTYVQDTVTLAVVFELKSRHHTPGSASSLSLTYEIQHQTPV